MASSLDGHEPLPFLVEDILIIFDDDRGERVLSATRCADALECLPSTPM
ncbi:MAG: hypothetical protein ACQESR_25605 [Planctomycetota bacterium]